MLQLLVSPRYAAKWMSHQWDRWLGLMASLRIFASTLAASRESAHRRALMVAASSSTAATTASSGPDFTLPEWYAAAPALLALLARWSSHLPQPSKANARKLLSTLVGLACSHADELTWVAHDCVDDESISMQGEVHGAVAVKIVRGKVDMGALATGFPALARMMRSRLD